MRILYIEYIANDKIHFLKIWVALQTCPNTHILIRLKISWIRMYALNF